MNSIGCPSAGSVSTARSSKSSMLASIGIGYLLISGFGGVQQGRVCNLTSR